jgi:hypothetical protein
MFPAPRQFRLSDIVLEDPDLCDIYRCLGRVVLVPLDDRLEEDQPGPSARTFADTQGDAYAQALTSRHVGVRCGPESANLHAFAFPKPEMETFLEMNRYLSKTTLIDCGRYQYALYKVQRFCPESVSMGCGEWLGNGRIVLLKVRGKNADCCRWISSYPPLEFPFKEFKLPHNLWECFAPVIAQQRFGPPTLVGPKRYPGVNATYWAYIFVHHKSLLFDGQARQFYTRDKTGGTHIISTEALRVELAEFIMGSNVFSKPLLSSPPTSQYLDNIVAALQLPASLATLAVQCGLPGAGEISWMFC